MSYMVGPHHSVHKVEEIILFSLLGHLCGISVFKAPEFYIGKCRNENISIQSIHYYS